MVNHSVCPLCSSEKTEKYLETRDFFLTRETYFLFRCSACGFVFTQDHPDQTDIDRYYESDAYLSHNDSTAGFSSFLYRLTRSLMLRRKRQIIRRSTGLSAGTLLDIGSGTGHFISSMRESGWVVKGTEISKKVRDKSIAGFALDIISPGQITSLPRESFDCITLWHVLEHFQEPDKIATEILRLLKPEGTCLVALPNSSSSDARHYGTFWAAWDVPRHLWHFTPATFKTFAEKNGFRISGIRTLPADVFYISILSEKYRGTNLPFMTGIIKGFRFALLSLFCKNRSSSLIYILTVAPLHR